MPSIIFGNISDIGRIRKTNQDYFSVTEGEAFSKGEKTEKLFLVADGMGGHRGGEVASQMAATLVSKYYFENKNNNICERLTEAIEKANADIYEKSTLFSELRGMGTTIVALVISGSEAYIAHAGDSRIYLIRNNAIKQITKDHSYVQRLIDLGIIDEDNAKHHPERNIITKALGIDTKIEPEALMPPLALAEGDIFILCTDGLTGVVDDNEILHDVLKFSHPQESCKSLVNLANKRGGHDNITLQIVKIKELTDAHLKKTVKTPVDTKPILLTEEEK